MLEYCEREDKPFTFVPHQQVESENLFFKNYCSDRKGRRQTVYCASSLS